MNNEKVSAIVDNVYNATINSNLIWLKCYESDYIYKFEINSPDGLTKFTIRVRLSESLSFSEDDVSLNIENPKIINRSIDVYPRMNKNVSNIGEFVYDNYISKIISKKGYSNQEDVLDDINKYLDLPSFRESKINDVLKND